MHTYDVPRRRPFQPVPAARAAQDTPGGPSATPIYDALYAEWVRSYRALPGDRQGEEELGFEAFGNLPQATNSFSSFSSYGSYSPHNSYSSYSAGAYSARRQTNGRQQPGTGTQHVPAALPPAPRREP
ncbi:MULTISPECIES: hypothetical protein [unclassified Streptomyces]|uniref:hypothetical protein n=1 Tax=unclassified Streptomyces TaxID=2593676 RepID=UPI0036633266